MSIAPGARFDRLETDPNAVFTHLLLGWTYQQQLKYEDAIAEFQKVRQLESDLWAITMLGNVYGVSGRKDEARKMLAELQEEAKKRYVSPYFFALIYIGLGEKDQAFVWLDKADEERNDYMVYLKVEPLFDSLRSDPRFQALVRKIGLTP